MNLFLEFMSTSSGLRILSLGGYNCLVLGRPHSTSVDGVSLGSKGNLDEFGMLD